MGARRRAEAPDVTWGEREASSIWLAFGAGVKSAWPYLMPNRLFRRKSLDHLVGETTEPRHQLKRALGPGAAHDAGCRRHRRGRHLFDGGTAAAGEVADGWGRDRRW